MQLFFVLSGYVLARSLSRQWGPGAIPGYWVRRYIRIRAPFAAAVLFASLAGVLLVAVPAHQGLTRWIVPSTRLHVPFSDLIEYLALPGTVRGLMRHGWTLRIEMIFSIALPFMLWLAIRAHWILLVVIGAALLGWAPRGSDYRYFINFALGIAIFMERDRLARWLESTPRWLQVALLLLAIGTFAAPQYLGWTRSQRGILVLEYHDAVFVTMSLGSALLVILAAHAGSVQVLFAGHAARALGRVSYSLYLFHWTILVTLAPLAVGEFGWLKFLLFEAGVIGASLLVAHLAERWIERPSIEAARRLGRWTTRNTAGLFRLRPRWSP